jgi:sulfite reductase (NADPH) flavoprotein alpha-component
LADSAPALEDDEKLDLAGFFTGLESGTPGVPVLPPSAPLRTPVRLWVDGLLAGRYSRATVAEVPGDGPLVLWASQTGNAEGFASQVANRLNGSRLMAMDEATLDDLTARRDVVIVTSTFGDGGPPDNGAEFWDRLGAPDAPTLDGVRYAVLGIGDRSYDEFCGHAKSLDRRLADLGATKLVDRTECEAYEDEPMTKWADRIVDLIDGADPAAAVSAPTVAKPFTRANPLRAPLCRNVLLTPRTAAKEVRQFGFDVSEHDVTYDVGDALGVFVANAPAVVDAWLAATGLSGTEPVAVDGAEVALREALVSSYDICRVTPNLLTFIAERCTDESAGRILKAPKAARDAWLVGRNGVDVVEEFAVLASAEEWQEALVRLTPRSYSISSSPLVSPHEVQLTVSVLRYRSVRGGDRGGVSSTFLADRASHAEVFLQPSPHFRPPEDGATPMIMVGPGTGIAPFRGFLQERRALGHPGRNWLFFGDQHRAENFYYRDDLEDMVRDGLLNRLDLAFSRDQADRVYVQHKIGDYGADVWRWLEDGANFYVCGDASRMAKDVDAALTAIIRTHGGMSDEAAHDYKRELVATKRYVRDVY